MTLDEYLTAQKRDNGLTETGFAIKAGLSQSQVNRLRKGKTWASRDVILRIIEASDKKVTAADLIGLPAEAAE